jgi:hypothetical protein
MQRLRSRLGAWWLLLLLGRILAPDAAVLRLHAHHHTVEVALSTPEHTPGTDRAKLSKQHQHCHTEQLFAAAFQPALPPAIPLPRIVRSYPVYRITADVCPARHLLPGAALRGPPLA